MNDGDIQSNIAKVLLQVSTLSQKYQRGHDSVKVLAVSKTKPADAIRSAAAAGQQDFGENYLQEALDKIKACADLTLCWHFIGPIQSNKTRAIAENFAWVHSVEREKILRRLSEQRGALQPPLNICLQVNVSGEASKAGATAEELPDLLALASSLPRLSLRGLMAIPAPSTVFAEQRAACESLAELFRDAKERYPQMDTLSVGMSADMEAAIAAGSTMVRIGTAIFGVRSAPGKPQT